jgi:hypothetical protein
MAVPKDFMISDANSNRSGVAVFQVIPISKNIIDLFAFFEFVLNSKNGNVLYWFSIQKLN